MPLKKETPEFKPDTLEVLSSVFLAGLLLVISFYTQWGAQALGATASFNLTHGISASWLGVTGSVVSIITMLLAWKGFGLNAIAAFLVSVSLATTVTSSSEYTGSISTLFAITWLVIAIKYTRRFYEHNPLYTFLALWWLTFASSVSQSMFYKFVYNNDYPLSGVLTLKSAIFGLGGLTILFAFPRKNKEFEI